jgi:hypothetical protein
VHEPERITAAGTEFGRYNAKRGAPRSRVRRFDSRLLSVIYIFLAEKQIGPPDDDDGQRDVGREDDRACQCTPTALSPAPGLRPTRARDASGHRRTRAALRERLDGRVELPRRARDLPHLLRKVRCSCPSDLSLGAERAGHSVLPGIAFSLDLIETTGKYGVAEVLLSSFIAAAVFSLFGAQPLCIAGVTGECPVSPLPLGSRPTPTPRRPDYRPQ